MASEEQTGHVRGIHLAGVPEREHSPSQCGVVQVHDQHQSGRRGRCADARLSFVRLPHRTDTGRDQKPS
jgi:hypothetical protein